MLTITAHFSPLHSHKFIISQFHPNSPNYPINYSYSNGERTELINSLGEKKPSLYSKNMNQIK